MLVGLLAALTIGFTSPGMGAMTMIKTEPLAPGLSKGFYGFKMKDIDGKTVSLGEYKGKVVLVVNVASHCGFTPQYAGLEKLYLAEKAKGFVILGFPANQFGAQEPGSDAEIKQFCTATYNVTFPMFSKIVVKGDGIHPLYQWLLANADRHNDIEWNFCKFLISKDGKILKRYTSKVTPDSKELTSAIHKALEQ